jgi:UDP-glucose 4-epimerase
MPKVYLVTGGAGFIGSHLIDALLARGDEVVVLDNLCSGTRANLPQGVKLVTGDIREICELDDQIGHVDTIIHLAALISGYDSLHDPDDYDAVNIRGLLRVIEFAKRRSIGRIVFASSSTVYGNNREYLLSEEMLPAPLSVYALTKLAGEHLLNMYGKLHGFSHVSLRLFNVYGPRQAVDHPYANVTCKFSHAAAHGTPVKLFGDGTQSRDFVYVADVVNAFIAVLEESEQPVYNVGTGADNSIGELLRVLGEIRGTPLETEQCDPWPNDIQRIKADTGRIRDEFAFEARTSLRQGLQATVDYFLSGAQR